NSGQPRGNAVVSPRTADLFHEVNLSLEIMSPRWGLDLHPVFAARRNPATETHEDSMGFLRRDLHAEQCPDAFLAEQNATRRKRARVNIQSVLDDRSSADFAYQRSDSRKYLGNGIGVHPAFEPETSIGVKPESLCGPTNRSPIEARTFDEQALRGILDATA